MSRSTLIIRSNTTSNNFNSDRNPNNADDISKAYDIGSLWVNVSTDKCFLCLDNYKNRSIWKLIKPDPILEAKVINLEARMIYLELVIKNLTGLSK